MVIIKCLICGKQFKDIPSRAKIRKTCSRSCQSILNNTGRKYSQETIKKMRKSDAWNHIDEIIVKYLNRWAITWLAKEYKCDTKTIRNILKERNVKSCGRKGIKAWNKGGRNKYWQGKNNPNWKGGITPLCAMIRRLPESRNWIEKVFKRDNWTCQECSQRGGDLQAHHLKLFSEIINENKIRTIEQAINCNELWNIDNGKTLCEKCHRKTFKYIKMCSNNNG